LNPNENENRTGFSSFSYFCFCTCFYHVLHRRKNLLRWRNLGSEWGLEWRIGWLEKNTEAKRIWFGWVWFGYCFLELLFPYLMGPTRFNLHRRIFSSLLFSSLTHLYREIVTTTVFITGCAGNISDYTRWWTGINNRINTVIIKRRRRIEGCVCWNLRWNWLKKKKEQKPVSLSLSFAVYDEGCFGFVWALVVCVVCEKYFICIYTKW